jgi:two-component system sensor histidine kinase DesK
VAEEIVQVAGEALSEVRAAVAGYRSGGIEAEVQRARTALTAAGVEVECELSQAALPATHEAVLALALREAVTNVIRHAGATRCSIRLSADAASCSLTVADDGRGGNAPFGNGLSGMQERVEVLGGTITRDGARGTALSVTLPIANAQERSA